MRSALVALALSALVVTAAAGSTSAEASGPGQTSAALDEAAKALLHRSRSILDDKLVDYSSARLRQFRAVRAPRVYYSDGGNPRIVPFLHRGEPRTIFCGEVNSRNRMGGYTGWQQVAIQPEEEDWNALTVAGNRQDDAELALLCDPAARDAERGSLDFSDLLVSATAE